MNESKIAKTSTINLVGNGTRTVLSFFLVLFASRWLGAEKFGEFSLIWAYVTPFNFLLSLGFEYSFPYFISKYQSEKQVGPIKKLFFTAIFSSLIIAPIVLFFAYLGFSHLLELKGLSHLKTSLLFLFVQTEFWALSSLIAGFLRGHKDFLPGIFMEQFTIPIGHFLALVISVLLLNSGVQGFSFAYAVGSFLGLVAVLFFGRKTLGKVLKENSDQVLLSQKKSWIKYSLPLGIMTTLESLMILINLIVIGWFLHPIEVGLFNICVKVSLITNFLFLAVGQIFAPYISDAFHKKDSSEMEKLYCKMANWCMKWTFSVSLTLIIAAGPILAVFGEEYQGASLILFVTLIGCAFEACFGGTKQILAMSGHNFANSNYYFITIVLMSLFGVIFTQIYGTVGAALAFSAGYIFLNLARILKIYRHYKILPLRRLGLLKFFVATVFLILLSFASMQLEIGTAARWLIAVLSGGIVLLMSFWSDRSQFFSIAKRP